MFDKQIGHKLLVILVPQVAVYYLASGVDHFLRVRTRINHLDSKCVGTRVIYFLFFFTQ